MDLVATAVDVGQVVKLEALEVVKVVIMEEIVEAEAKVGEVGE